MEPTSVIYEHPLNERTRMLLRLEFLFQQAEHTLQDDTIWGCRQSLSHLLEILAVLARGDVKAEVHKELERQTLALGRLANRDDIDSSKLQGALSELQRTTARLHDEAANLGQYLKSNDFITAVRSRSALPGGLCEFDVPAYHFWLQHSAEQRVADLNQWFDRLWVLRDAINLSLELTRSSASGSNQLAQYGNFNKSMDSSQPALMLRLIMPTDFKGFPEVSGGKHRIAVRFLTQPNIAERAIQVEGDVPFNLVICSL